MVCCIYNIKPENRNPGMAGEPEGLITGDDCRIKYKYFRNNISNPNIRASFKRLTPKPSLHTDGEGAGGEATVDSTDKNAEIAKLNRIISRFVKIRWRQLCCAFPPNSTANKSRG